MLSISKLEKLLAIQGFTASKYYIVHGFCSYVEVISVTNADTFLLFIPSKYKFKMDHGTDTYKIRYIQMDNIDKSTAENYVGSPDNIALEKAYTEIETLTNDGYTYNDDENLSSHLEEAYRRPIYLKDINKEDTKDVRDVFRQLRRLKYCVQNIKHKLSIIFKNYLCVLSRSDNVDCFLIKHYPKSDQRKLLPLIDLELFYQKLENIASDVSNIKKGVFRVLDKNQDMHTRNLKKMLEEKNDILALSINVHLNKSKYDAYIHKFQGLLTNTIEREKQLVTKLYNINSNGDSSIKGFHTDITRAHQKGKIEDELSNIDRVKQDILLNIMKLNGTMEDMVLSVDKIFFDNTIMMDEIFKNFNRLRNIQ